MKILFIKYDQASGNITSVTADDKFNDSNWTPVAVYAQNYDYMTNNFQLVKYDAENKALIYPHNFVENNALTNDNATTIDKLAQQSESNAKILNDIQYKTAWNHLMQIFTLPDDLPFLNRAYGISTDVSTLKVTSFDKTGTYLIPAWSNVKLPDAPDSVDYTAGCMFTIYHLGDTFVYVRFTDSNGTYINHFSVGTNITNKWKQVESFEEVK